MLWISHWTANGQLGSGFPANFFTPYFPSFGPNLPLASSADAVKEEKTTAPQQLQTSFNLGFPSQGRPFNFGQFGGINGISGGVGGGGGDGASADVDTAQPGPVVGFYGTVPNIGTHLGFGAQGGTPTGAAGNGFGTLIPKQNQALGGLGSSAGTVTNQLPQQQLGTSGLGLFGNNFPSFNFGPSFPSHPSPPTAEGTPVTSIQDTINKPGGQWKQLTPLN